MADTTILSAPAVGGSVAIKLYELATNVYSFIPPTGYDSAGNPLPVGFEHYAKAVTQTWDATTDLPLVRTEVVTVGANTYTRTTTNTLTGSDITGTTVTRWVKA